MSRQLSRASLSVFVWCAIHWAGCVTRFPGEKVTEAGDDDGDDVTEGGEDDGGDDESNDAFEDSLPPNFKGIIFLAM